MSKYKITLDGKTYEMEIERMDKADILADSRAQTPESSVLTKQANGAVKLNQDTVQSTIQKAVVSPMPGMIIKVSGAVGDVIEKGQVVLVLEAMKMENEIVSPENGRIVAIHVAEGDSVQGDTVLFEIGQ